MVSKLKKRLRYHENGNSIYFLSLLWINNATKASRKLIKAERIHWHVFYKHRRLCKMINNCWKNPQGYYIVPCYLDKKCDYYENKLKETSKRICKLEENLTEIQVHGAFPRNRGKSSFEGEDKCQSTK